jgi:hypothetical protein
MLHYVDIGKIPNASMLSLNACAFPSPTAVCASVTPTISNKHSSNHGCTGVLLILRMYLTYQRGGSETGRATGGHFISEMYPRELSVHVPYSKRKGHGLLASRWPVNVNVCEMNTKFAQFAPGFNRVCSQETQGTICNAGEAGCAPPQDYPDPRQHYARGGSITYL